MSVDERLRTALQQEMLPGTDTAGAYEHVLHATRRRAARRRAVVAAAVVALAAASGLTALQPWQDQRVEPATPPAARHDVVPAPQSTTEELEGHWAARGWVDFDRMAATVRAAGLGRWVDELHAELPADRMKLTLEFRQGFLISRNVESDTGRSGVVDYRLARLDGDRMTLAFDSGRPGRTVYQWEVVDDTLRFRFRRTTEGVQDGMPGEVYQRALYTTVPFHRVG